MMKSMPRGAPLGAAHRLTVMSYNLLAPIYVRPIDQRTGTVQAFAAFPWAEPADQVLDWAARRPKLLEELKASEADVICLQEVQFEPTDGGNEFMLPSWLQLDGYVTCIPGQKPLNDMAQRNERVLRVRAPVGNALLYRADRLEAAEGTTKGKIEQSTTRVGVCVRGRANSGLASLDRLALFSVHLDATAEDKRVKALAKCLEYARQSFGTRNVLIAGDLNAELLPGSCVASMVRSDAGVATSDSEPTEEEMQRECASALRLGVEQPVDDATGEGEDGNGSASVAGSETAAEKEGQKERSQPSAAQMAAWKQLYESARTVPGQQRIELHRVPTGATRAAYDHGRDTGPCAKWRLDHILFTPRALSLSSWTATLEAHPEAAAAGLPTVGYPSDHLFIGASFEPLEPPVLQEATRVGLLDRIEALLEAQASERAELSATLADEVRALEEVERARQAVDVGDADEEPSSTVKDFGKKPKKKKKGAPPSAEMQTLLRSRRERERALKAAQRARREAEFAALGEPERDALEAAAVDLVGPETE